MARDYVHPFFELQEKSFSLELAKSTKNEKYIFRENFSSLSFDSGKIFKIILFARGPRTPYSTVYDNIHYLKKPTPTLLCTESFTQTYYFYDIRRMSR